MIKAVKIHMPFIYEMLFNFINAGARTDTNKTDVMRIRSFNILTLAGILVICINIIFLIFGEDTGHKVQLIVCNVVPFLFCILLHSIMRMHKPGLSYFLAFTVFPLSVFLMSIYLEDRAVIYFQIVLIICVFYFFDSYKIIIPVSLLALGYFAYGIYHLLYDGVHIYQRHVQNAELVSCICAILFFYFLMYFLTGRIKNTQHKINGQKIELKKINNILKQKSRQLEDRNIVLNKVFSIVSHDLRVPIEGLKMIMKAAKSEEELMGTMHEILPDFKKELIKMSNLFENLISWAKLELNETPFEIKEVNVNLVANKVINILRFPAVNKAIYIKKQITRDLKCHADNDVIEIILRNLVSNAIKFTNSGGTITIKAFEQENVFYLQVCDTGIGMDAKTLAAIMENGFYSTCGTQKEIGTGLGLMICHDMVEKLNGKINIKSTKGEGTCVSIQIPVKTAVVETVCKPSYFLSRQVPLFKIA
jgi:signal transduction histidine kinase